jgi:hypothetical protein
MRDFIGIVMRYDYHEYIDKISEESENVYESCEVSIASVHFTKIANVSRSDTKTQKLVTVVLGNNKTKENKLEKRTADDKHVRIYNRQKIE